MHGLNTSDMKGPDKLDLLFYMQHLAKPWLLILSSRCHEIINKLDDKCVWRLLFKTFACIIGPNSRCSQRNTLRLSFD